MRLVESPFLLRSQWVPQGSLVYQGPGAHLVPGATRGVLAQEGDLGGLGIQESKVRFDLLDVSSEPSRHSVQLLLFSRQDGEGSLEKKEVWGIMSRGPQGLKGLQVLLLDLCVPFITPLSNTPSGVITICDGCAFCVCRSSRGVQARGPRSKRKRRQTRATRDHWAFGSARRDWTTGHVWQQWRLSKCSPTNRLAAKSGRMMKLSLGNDICESSGLFEPNYPGAGSDWFLALSSF